MIVPCCYCESFLSYIHIDACRDLFVQEHSQSIIIIYKMFIVSIINQMLIISRQCLLLSAILALTASSSFDNRSSSSSEYRDESVLHHIFHHLISFHLLSHSFNNQHQSLATWTIVIISIIVVLICCSPCIVIIICIACFGVSIPFIRRRNQSTSGRVLSVYTTPTAAIYPNLPPPIPMTSTEQTTPYHRAFIDEKPCTSSTTYHTDYHESIEKTSMNAVIPSCPPAE